MTTERVSAPQTFWCYLAEAGGRLVALPDTDRAVLLPFINAVPQVAGLSSALIPPYVLGLVNVAQRGELLIDLARLLGLRTNRPGARDGGRRMVLYGEGILTARNPHRLAFAIEQGYELAEATSQSRPSTQPLGIFIREMVVTPRGNAALIDMETACNKVLHDLGATRLWNDPDPLPDEEEPDQA